MPKRIIPVSSGKGGVGKTTVATNFALSLSRYAPTILVDLDTGIRYRRAEDPSGDFSRWIGRVLRCTVTMGDAGAHTTLLVDPLGPGPTGAKVALREADAAADAAKAEADRWGGVDRPPMEESERFW